jgi:hypothetical protein
MEYLVVEVMVPKTSSDKEREGVDLVCRQPNRSLDVGRALFPAESQRQVRIVMENMTSEVAASKKNSKGSTRSDSQRVQLGQSRHRQQCSQARSRIYTPHTSLQPP